MEAIKNRYEFVVLFDVENGNPNGDPDAGNAPRMDVETGYGIVTDVCLKRKIRNYVELITDGEEGFALNDDERRNYILIKIDKALNDKFVEAHKIVGDKGSKKETDDAARKFMCNNYYDVRTFGAVMATGDGDKEEKCACGTVRGPVQINFARSIDRISPQELSITRQAVTKASEYKKRMDKNGMATEMGKKNIVPYALYRAEGYVSALLAQKSTGFSEEDLELLWSALINMFEHDHSAARGKMCVRALYVFKHASVLGNAPSAVLFDKVKITRSPSVEYPRAYSDYTVTVDDNMPEGVQFIRKLG